MLDCDHVHRKVFIKSFIIYKQLFVCLQRIDTVWHHQIKNSFLKKRDDFSWVFFRLEVFKFQETAKPKTFWALAWFCVTYCCICLLNVITTLCCILLFFQSAVVSICMLFINLFIWFDHHLFHLIFHKIFLITLLLLLFIVLMMVMWVLCVYYVFSEIFG